MSMYTNIGGGSKQLTSLYINKDGSNKALNNVYGNINGSSKEIFTATKKHWWKRYEVTEWELKKIPKSSDMIVGAVKYNDEFGSDDLRIETSQQRYGAWSSKYLYYDPSISIADHFNNSTGFFDKEFIDNGTEIHSNINPSQYNKEIYIYSLTRYTDESDKYDKDIINVTNQQIYGRCLYHVTSSTAIKGITNYENKYVLMFIFDYVYTRWPKSFSSSYTLYSNNGIVYESSSNYPWNYDMGSPTKWNNYDMYRAKIAYGELSIFDDIGAASNTTDGGFVFVPDSAKYVYEGYHI